MTGSKVVNFLQSRVDLTRGQESSFLTPDFSSATRRGDILTWDPAIAGVLGGLVVQAFSGDHAGERHLEGDELIVAISGQLTVVLLDDHGGVQETIALQENEATLIPCGVWHRLAFDGECRYLFFGGGRTEIRRG
ncbi:cupin domain-containing protein [Dyella sp. 2HG41-7]|uniref:cupin domain-containing protein n=1 Tax=Dyella sp. 2HG41-7 TaxID=2883239 RepID=UPI001F4349AE|nr:cupin domain-containing protein [Dyella sp. 2HG41-7]